MNVTIKDIQKLVPSMGQNYLHTKVKSTGEYVVLNGSVHTLFSTSSIRTGLLEKLDITNKALRLSTKHRNQSRAMIAKILNALDKIEGRKCLQ